MCLLLLKEQLNDRIENNKGARRMCPNVQRDVLHLRLQQHGNVFFRFREAN